MTSTHKIPLPSFLKLLTSNNVPAAKAMAVAGKMSLHTAFSMNFADRRTLCYRYKDFNTPAMLSQLTDVKMKAAGIDDKDVRKLTLAAFRKAGYKASPNKASNSTRTPQAGPSPRTDDGAEPRPSTVQVLVSTAVNATESISSIPCN
jgi:hypothetical protein